jgi:hypothetical protein
MVEKLRISTYTWLATARENWSTPTLLKGAVKTAP